MIFTKQDAQKKTHQALTVFVACLLIELVKRKWDCTTITEVGRVRCLFDGILDESKIW